MSDTMTTTNPFKCYVAMQRTGVDAHPAPYVFTTEDVAEQTAKMCAILYVEAEAAPGSSVWVKFEQPEEPAIDVNKVTLRYNIDWDQARRSVKVERYDREANGLVWSGVEKRTQIAEFTVGSITRFISPLKTRNYFSVRKEAADKAASEKAAADLAAQLAKEAAAAAPASAAAAAAVVAKKDAAEVAAAAAPGPAAFDSALDAFTQ